MARYSRVIKGSCFLSGWGTPSLRGWYACQQPRKCPWPWSAPHICKHGASMSFRVWQIQTCWHIIHYTITQINPKYHSYTFLIMFSSLSTPHACASWYCDSKQGNKTCWWRLVASGRSQAYARPLWRTRKCHSSKNCWTIKPTVTSSTWKLLKQCRSSHHQKTIWHLTLLGLGRGGPG